MPFSSWNFKPASGLTVFLRSGKGFSSFCILPFPFQKNKVSFFLIEVKVSLEKHPIMAYAQPYAYNGSCSALCWYPQRGESKHSYVKQTVSSALLLPVGCTCKVFYIVLPHANWSSGVFACTSACEVVVANASSHGHLFKSESLLSWVACSPPRVARVITGAKTNLSSNHGN